MSDYPTYRKVVAVCACAGNGEAVYCDDGSVWYFLLNADAPRVPLEGTPVPGSARAAQLDARSVELKVPQWSEVARNLAQILSNTAAWIQQHEDNRTEGASVVDYVNPQELRLAFAKQCTAHGVTPL